MCNVANLFGNNGRNLLCQDILVLIATSNTDGIRLVDLEVRRFWRVLLAKGTTRSALWAVQGSSLALLFLELCAHGLGFEVLGVVKKIHGRIPKLWGAVWLAHGAQTYSVDADKRVVSYNIYPVTFAKTGDELLDLVGRQTSSNLVLIKEYLAETVVFVEPVVVAIFLPLLLGWLEAFEVRRPFSSSIKQVAQEQGGVRASILLLKAVRSPHSNTKNHSKKMAVGSLNRRRRTMASLALPHVGQAALIFRRRVGRCILIAHGIGRFALIVASCYVVAKELLRLFKLPAPFDHACSRHSSTSASQFSLYLGAMIFPKNAFAMLRPVIHKTHFINLAPDAAMRDVLREADLELEVDGKSRVANTHLLSVRQEFVQLALQFGSTVSLAVPQISLARLPHTGQSSFFSCSNVTRRQRWHWSMRSQE
ncbi:hypothetical protein KCU61_g785, partial [Aureobasidium melanogenum]